MIKALKKLWLYLVLGGIAVLAVAIYGSRGRKSDLKKVLEQRPQRKGTIPKLPKKPEVKDYMKLYKSRINNL